MQRDVPQILRVQVPTNFSAIAIIDLHPSAPQSHHEGESGVPLFTSWASDLVSALKRQQYLGSLLAYWGIAHVSVACAKSRVVAYYKMLVALKEPLGFQTSKRDIILQPADDRLQLAMHNLMLQMLKESGWECLQQNMLLFCSILKAEQGSVTACSYLRIINTNIQQPDGILVILQTGVARFRPLSIASLNPPSPDAASADWDCFNDKVWGMQMTCCLLPDLRPALLAGMQLAIEDEECLRQAWVMQHSLTLPAKIPCFYQVRFSADPDEPVAVVPSCCVWTGTGLNTIPAKAGTDAATLDLQRIAGSLVKSPLALWPGKLSFGVLQQQTASSPVPADAWRSAKEVDSRTNRSTAQGSSQVSAEPLLPVLYETPSDLPGKSNVAHLGADLSRMLLQLGSGKPEEAPKASIPQLWAGSHQQPQLPPHKQPARPAPALAVREPAEVAARSQPRPNNTQMQAKAALTPQFAGGPGQKQPVDIQSGGSCAAQNATGGQVQKPVFAKHKRPGQQLQAKAPMMTIAVPADAKKAKLTPAPPSAPVTAPARVRSATQLSTVAAHALLEAVEANTAAVMKATLAAPARMPSAAQLGSVSAAPATKAAARALQKAAPLDTAQVEAKVRQMWAQGLKEKLSVPEIKCFLRAQKKALGGKKAELLERLSAVLNDTPNAT